MMMMVRRLKLVLAGAVVAMFLGVFPTPISPKVAEAGPGLARRQARQSKRQTNSGNRQNTARTNSGNRQTKRQSNSDNRQTTRQSSRGNRKTARGSGPGARQDARQTNRTNRQTKAQTNQDNRRTTTKANATNRQTTAKANQDNRQAKRQTLWTLPKGHTTKVISGTTVYVVEGKQYEKAMVDGRVAYVSRP